MERVEIHAPLAAEVISQNLGALHHPAYVIRLMQFAHKSKAVAEYAKHVGEAIILLLERNGFHICNGLSEAVSLLESNGYEVVKIEAVDGGTEASAS